MTYQQSNLNSSGLLIVSIISPELSKLSGGWGGGQPWQKNRERMTVWPCKQLFNNWDGVAETEEKEEQLGCLPWEKEMKGSEASLCCSELPERLLISQLPAHSRCLLSQEPATNKLFSGSVRVRVHLFLPESQPELWFLSLNIRCGCCLIRKSLWIYFMRVDSKIAEFWGCDSRDDSSLGQTWFPAWL